MNKSPLCLLVAGLTGGFMAAADGAALLIDFNANVDNNNAGYQSYQAVHENIASFTSPSYAPVRIYGSHRSPAW